MNPWDILAWVAALSASAVVAALAVTIAVAAVRSVSQRPARAERTTTVIGGDR